MTQHWSDFLEMVTPQTIWAAKTLAICRPPLRFPELPGASTPLKLNLALLNHFLPGSPVEDVLTILLPYMHATPLVATEIDRVLARSSPLSAPGADMTPISVCKRINKVAPDLILNLLSSLVSYGFHPPSLKGADGIILDNPRKPSYDSPSSFQIIILLQNFSKIMERIMNGRLSCLARVTVLLNPHHCGSLMGLSVADMCNTHTHEIRTVWMDKRKVSALFLDIRGGFANDNPSALCGMLAAQGVNLCLVSWPPSFFTG